MQPDDTTHDAPLGASDDHRITSPQPSADVGETVAPTRTRLRTPFGCYP